MIEELKEILTEIKYHIDGGSKPGEGHALVLEINTKLRKILPKCEKPFRVIAVPTGNIKYFQRGKFAFDCRRSNSEFFDGVIETLSVDGNWYKIA